MNKMTSVRYFLINRFQSEINAMFCVKFSIDLPAEDVTP